MLTGSSNTLVENFEHVWDGDPCFDNADPEAFAKAWKHYEQTGDWQELPRLPNAEPTIFILRHLRGEALVKAQQLSNHGENLRAGYFAARCSLHEIRNITFMGKTYTKDGPLKLPMDGDPDTGYAVVRESMMADLYKSFQGPMLSCGLRAIQRAQPDPT